MTSTKTILSRILFVLYLAAIAFLCFMRVDKLPEIQHEIFGLPADKIAHFLMFLPFPIIARCLFIGKTKKPFHSLLLALGLFLAGCIIAAGTEIGQGMTDYRTADPNDFLSDGIGLGLGAIIALIFDLRAAFEKTQTHNA